MISENSAMRVARKKKNFFINDLNDQSFFSRCFPLLERRKKHQKLLILWFPLFRTFRPF